MRGVFYRAVSRGLVAKTEREYKNTVARKLAEMRESNELPWRWIVDNSRWSRKPVTHSSLEIMLARSHDMYRRALWDNQDAYVEIWVEKDAISGIFYEVTSQWDVPLMVTRGYPSLTFIYQAAEVIEAQVNPAYIYYFGDYDPDGLNIFETVQRKIQERTSSWVHIHHMAVTPQQVVQYELPTRPTKKTARGAAKFGSLSVELDAMPTKVLKQIVEACITRHIDPEALEATEMAEREEIKTLGTIVDAVSGNWPYGATQ